MMIRSKYIDKYEIVMRSAGRSDAAALAELDKVCFSIPWSVQAFDADLNDLQKSIYLVWEARLTGSAASALSISIDANKNEIIGYGGFWQIVDDAEIMNIAIHPDWRRLNLAGELLECLIEIAKSNKMKTMTLEVRTGNNAAIALYSKYGFDQSGIRHNYYADNGEDAIIMLKKI